MANAESALKLVEKGCWEHYVQYQQLDDGTLAYLEMSTPQKFYAKFNGKRIDAVLPVGKFKMIDAHDNAVYLMKTNELITQPATKHYADGFLDYRDQVFEAVFTPPASLTISLLKNRAHPYQIFGASNSIICTTRKNGKEYAHKLWHVSESDDILIGVDTFYQLISVHRKQLYFFNLNEFLTKQSVDKIRENCYAINIFAYFPWISIHTRDSTAFYYLTDGMYLYTLNTDTKKFLSPLYFGRREFEGLELIGIFNELLTLRGTHNGLNYLLTVQLPTGYPSFIYDITNSATVSEDHPRIEPTIMAQDVGQTSVDVDSVHKKMDVMRSIISELQDRNSNLSDELERLQILNREVLRGESTRKEGTIVQTSVVAADVVNADGTSGGSRGGGARKARRSRNRKP